MFKKPHNLLIVYKKRREKKLNDNDKFYQECILKNRAPGQCKTQTGDCGLQTACKMQTAD